MKKFFVLIIFCLSFSTFYAQESDELLKKLVEKKCTYPV